ncbi:Thiamin phosphate synthase [Basidiobolus meristosporus CBS 931.73]|uniref:Thiamin phosphate synthase n=1 Tax=Basidiobolus meristosporus CBS 931.73 TaxID=1314790 RepID=A0A1Y1Y6Q1_9FUNG|nr:Thiamin phosphate synthase [Basidiobolus meristosporus CBS 931.73]|eukprot:ORX93396.1 Thiamin phosphate synthase [Basidiobolus meristosporus CBS 931.73]
MLPLIYIITDNATDSPIFQSNLNACLTRSNAFIQFRLKSLTSQGYLSYLESACQLAGPKAKRLLLNTGSLECLGEALATCLEFPAGGVHLVSKDLMSSNIEEVLKKFKEQWNKEHPPVIAASCHTIDQLRKAQFLGLDFVVLSPILPSTTCPSNNYLGWEGFQKLIAQAGDLPVYALGGLNGSHLPIARQYGAQGVAAINAFWNKHDLNSEVYSTCKD